MYLGQTSPQSKTTATLHALPAGNAGVRATLNLMRELVRHYKKDLNIRNLAAQIVSPLQQKNFVGEVKRLHGFVRDNVRYVRDIHGVETIQTPPKTLEFGYGDCDDKATLLAALLESIGHPTRFVAIGMQPGKLSHVYVETLIGPNRSPDSWIGLETTEPVPAGWKPRNVAARMMVYN